MKTIEQLYGFQLEMYVINFRTLTQPFQHVWGEVRYVCILYRKPNHVSVTGLNNDNRKRKLRMINITHPAVLIARAPVQTIVGAVRAQYNDGVLTLHTSHVCSTVRVSKK